MDLKDTFSVLIFSFRFCFSLLMSLHVWRALPSFFNIPDHKLPPPPYAQLPDKIHFSISLLSQTFWHFASMFPWFAVSSIGIFFYSDSDIYVTYSPHNLLLVLSFSNQTKFPTPFLSSIARKSRLSDCDCYFFLMSWSPNWENSYLFCLEPTQIGFWWVTMAAELWWLIFYLVHEDVYYWIL